MVLNEVSKVYMHITGNRISKQNTSADAVIGVFEEQIDEWTKEAIKDEMKIIEGREARLREALEYLAADENWEEVMMDGGFPVAMLFGHDSPKELAQKALEAAEAGDE